MTYIDISPQAYKPSPEVGQETGPAVSPQLDAKPDTIEHPSRIRRAASAMGRIIAGNNLTF